MSTPSPAILMPPSRQPQPPAAASQMYSAFTINGQKPTVDSQGNIEVPKLGKIQIQFKYDAGVLNQGPAEYTVAGFSTPGASAKPGTAQELTKEWKVDSHTSMPNGSPVPAHQMGGQRLQTITLTAPKLANGTGLALELKKAGFPDQTLKFITESAEPRTLPQAPAALPTTTPAALAAQAGAIASANGGGKTTLPTPAAAASGSKLNLAG